MWCLTSTAARAVNLGTCASRGALEDSRLFGPSPWKILARTNEQTYLSNPAPGENLLSGNLVMETGCKGVPRTGGRR